MTLNRIVVMILAVVLLALVAGAAWHPVRTATTPPFSASKEYLDAVGPVQAQKIAWQSAQAGKPLTVGHMFEHAVGSYLFHTYGMNGVHYCKTYFDHGCYNGYMLEMTSLDMIESALSACSVMNQDSMGGCLHGAGHKALTILNNFNVPLALKQCDTFIQKYAPASSSPAMLDACSFGVFMENAEPGMMEEMAKEALMGDMQMTGMNAAMVNSPTLPPEHKLWETRESDPLYPCDSSRIEPRYLPGCWRMQGTVLANKLPVTKTVDICSTLTDVDQKQNCFAGITDAYSAMGMTSVSEMVAACNTATGVEWKNTCLIDFMKRVYLDGGDDTVPNQICAQIDPSGTAECTQTQAKLKHFLSN